MSPHRPPGLLVYAEALNHDLVSAVERERIERLLDPLLPAPVASFDDDAVRPHLASVEVLLTGWGCPRLDAATLERLPKLRAAFHAAGTVKNHVTPACFDRGIRVTSAAQANARPVAEFTVAAIVLANKRAFRAQRRYRAQRAFRLWSREFPGLGNHGKIVGLVGASRIGRLVLERLRPFDFEILLCDPTLEPAAAAALGVETVGLEELLERSDVVSLHAPSLPGTRHMIDRDALARMRDGAILVNTARGALVDTDALTEELVSGRLDAVLDTTDPEVLPEASPLYELENVFLTPHIAGSLGAETRRMMNAALDELERFNRNEPLLDEIRREDWDTIA